MTIEVGTASWTDPSLIGCRRFYPRGCSNAEARLRYYASRFPLVEVDSSYYALPSARNAALWAERTPRGFRFNVKAFRIFTGHQTPAQALPKDIVEALTAHFAHHRNVYYRDLPNEIRDELWTRFEHGIAPLRDAGKLGCVHFQFPPWVTPGAGAYAHIDACRSRLAGFTLATEFRQRTWFDAAHRDATLAFERSRGCVHVVVDAPQGFANSVPPVWEVADPHCVIVRLHGRNAATWNVRGASASSERFNYDYPRDELADLAHRVRALDTRAAVVQVVFNNNYEDQGQRNAATLQTLLADAEPPGDGPDAAE
ncbi:MAG TPA: DUF72 domain-containing protein [Rhodanobacteraceae bacterium]